MTQVSKINGIPVFNTVISGFTYDNINTFTIENTDGTSFTASINSLSASTISGGTFFGDGSGLTNLPSSTNTYTTGSTYLNNTITFTNSTGGTYDVTINDFTGLTINGSLSATTISATTFYGDGGNLTGVASTATADTITLDFSFDGTYVQGGTSFGQIPLQVIIQSATTYNSSFPTMSGTLICDVSQGDSTITGEFDLYNLSDSSQVTGSVTTFVDTDGLKSSVSFSLGSGEFDDSFRVRVRRTGGAGDVAIRSAQLILTLT
jgi:hypothetical protein